MRRRFSSVVNVKFDYLKYMTIEALTDDVMVEIDEPVLYGVDGVGWMRFNKYLKLKKGQYLSIKYELQQGKMFGQIRISGGVNLWGNCLSLIFGDNAIVNNDLTGYNSCFASLFESCHGIKCVDNNFLPATTLADYCYSYMFGGCTSLVQAPELPATTLADYCYMSMFYSCTSLVQAPELPATTLADYCYMSMFESCFNLVQAPELPATTLARLCYDHMFYVCTKLNYIKMLATDISAEYCLSYWVQGVSSTGTFVKNKNATWNVVGVSGVPEGWTVKTE